MEFVSRVLEHMNGGAEILQHFARRHEGCVVDGVQDILKWIHRLERVIVKRRIEDLQRSLDFVLYGQRAAGRVRDRAIVRVYPLTFCDVIKGCLIEPSMVSERPYIID